MAVFYRTNAQSRVLEEELVRAGVPYKVVGGTRFYDRREIKDLLAYVRLLANPADEVSARRVVNVPKRGIGDTSVARLAAWAAPHTSTFADASPGGRGRPDRQGRSGGPSSWPRLWTSCGPLVGAVAPGRPGRSWWPTGPGYLAELVAERTHEADGRIENVAELVGVAAEYEDAVRVPRDGGPGRRLRRARRRRRPGSP